MGGEAVGSSEQICARILGRSGVGRIRTQAVQFLAPGVLGRRAGIFGIPSEQISTSDSQRCWSGSCQRERCVYDLH